MEYIEHMGLEWEQVHSRRAHMGRFLADEMQPQLPSQGSISYQWAEKWAAKQKTLKGIRDAQRRKRSLLGGWWPGAVEEDELVEYDKAFDRMAALVGRVFKAQEMALTPGASIFACAEPAVSSASVASSTPKSALTSVPQPTVPQHTGLGMAPDASEPLHADQAWEGHGDEMREASDEGKSSQAEQQAVGGAPPEDTPSGSHTGAGMCAQAPGAGNTAGCATISPRPAPASPFAGATWAQASVDDQQCNMDASFTAVTPCQLTSPPFKPAASPRPGQDGPFFKPGASAFAGPGQVMAWDEDMVADHGDRALIGTGAASMQPETPGACPRTPLQPSFDEEDGSSAAAQAKAGFQAVVAGSALDLEIHPQELDYGLEEWRRLGSGSFGVVCKGTWRKTSVAVKTFMACGVENHELDAFLSEVSILSRLRHPNVVLFLGAVLPSQGMPAAIVTEVASRGSLFHVLHRSGHPLTPARRLLMAMDIAKGLNYLHSCKPMIVHRDLKSQNLLVARDWSLKVCDFGMSQIKTTKFLSHGKDIGTCAYMAPEVLRLEPYTEKCDVFSFGVILWELATGDVPWDGENEWCAFGAVGLGGARLSVADDIQPDVKALLMDCWEEDATRRPSFDQILDRLEIMNEITPSASCAARRAHEKASGAAW